MNKTYYYLFGNIAPSYYTLDYTEFIQLCKNNDDWDLYKYSLASDPNMLLSAYTGWNNFSEIPEQTYRILEKIKHLKTQKQTAKTQ